ncbi:MAG TPA: methionyl-tRNA formyltransferase [bacterium]|nr:methionyl-tRNA formyltransferase [bacterium]
MKTVFFGTPEFSRASLLEIAASRHAICGVVTGKDKPQGRHLRVVPSAVKTAALSRGLPVFQFDDVNAPDALRRLADLEPDIFVVVSFGKILSRALLDLPRIGAINLHASLLPGLRGAAPIQRAVASGCDRTGNTIMFITERLDAGDIVLQEETAIRPDDTYGTLSGRLAETGARLLVRAMDMIETGSYGRTPQDESMSTYARKFSREETFVKWSDPARVIACLIRALCPKPCAHAVMTLRGAAQTVKILQAEALSEQASFAPGTVVRAGKDGIAVAAGEGVLAVTRLQLPGKKEMTAGEFINGHGIRHGDTFGA